MSEREYTIDTAIDQAMRDLNRGSSLRHVLAQVWTAARHAERLDAMRMERAQREARAARGRTGER